MTEFSENFNKKIKNVYKFVISDQNMSLIRMRGQFFHEIPCLVHYKPISETLIFHYTNTSDNADLLNNSTVDSFTSIPEYPIIYYYCRSNTIYKIDKLYLFQNMFTKYSVQYNHMDANKAESREEKISKQKSINFKKQQIDEEKPIELKYKE